MNPPQKPAIKKFFISERAGIEENNAEKKPIARQPIILTQKVFIGNRPTTLGLYAKDDTKNLNTQPRPPPKKTYKYDITFVICVRI